MGRKLINGITFALILIIFGIFIAVFSPAQAQSNDLRVYVRVLPEKPNAADGWFWQGADVRLKFEIRNSKLETISQTDEIKNLKIRYSWDNLDVERAVEYKDPFQPIEGEHWLFAWALNSDGSYATPATKFYMQFSLIPRVTPTLYRQQVSVSQSYLSWGNEGAPQKTGQITEEAASTSKLPTPTPTLKLQNSALQKLTGQKNIWILLLVVGLILLVVVKFVFRNKKIKINSKF